MVNSLPFDLQTAFDEQLRPYPLHPLQVKGALLYVRARLEHAQLSKAVEIGYLEKKAYLLGLTQEYTAAAACFEDILERLTQASLDGSTVEAKRISNRIRLGHMYQLQKNFQKSNALFTELLTEYDGWPEHLRKHYGHFLWQHAGKNALDQKRYAEAQTFFEKALSYRQENQLGQELIDSTQLALDVLKQRI